MTTNLHNLITISVHGEHVSVSAYMHVGMRACIRAYVFESIHG